MTSNQMKSDEVGGLWAVYVYWQAAKHQQTLAVIDSRRSSLSSLQKEYVES